MKPTLPFHNFLEEFFIITITSCQLNMNLQYILLSQSYWCHPESVFLPLVMWYDRASFFPLKLGVTMYWPKKCEWGSQMTPSDPCSWYPCPCVIFYNESGLFFVTNRTGRSDDVWFQRIHEAWLYCLPLWDPLVWAPRHSEDTKAVHEEVHVEKTEAPDNNQHQLASLVSDSPWKWILQPQTSLQMMLPQLQSYKKP